MRVVITCELLHAAPVAHPLSAMHVHSVQGLLLVGGDDAIRGGVGHAGQHKAAAHLSIIQEGLVGLVHVSRDHLAGAAGASASAARVGQVEASLLRDEEAGSATNQMQ